MGWCWDGVGRLCMVLRCVRSSVVGCIRLAVVGEVETAWPSLNYVLQRTISY